MALLHRLIFALGCLGVLAGCTFHSTQLEFVRSLFAKPEILPDQFWVLRLPDQSIPLVAYSSAELHTSFARDGLSLNFYTLELQTALGWPEAGSDIWVMHDGNRATHRLDGEQITVECADWAYLESEQMMYTDCAATEVFDWTYRKEIQLRGGRIVRMHYGLWPGLSPIELIWFPVSGENPSLLDELIP